MKLYEFEGKEIFKEAGIAVPASVAVTEKEQMHLFATLFTPFFKQHPEVVVKAQTLAGGRGKAGGIAFCQKLTEATVAAERFLGKQLLNETVTKLLIEEKLAIAEEYYLGIMFSQEQRCPVLIISKQGGMDIEEVGVKTPELIVRESINYLQGVDDHFLDTVLKKAGFTQQQTALKGVIKKLYAAFIAYDMKMVEINPLALTKTKQLIAADAVVVLDDAAQYRWKKSFPDRVGVGRELTEREREAHKIDEQDHRGVAGRTYIDLDGDIGILASGGGASITCVDALLSYGGKPANYTEYSGNPPEEKVEQLTRVVLSKPGLWGLWIIGGTANFTRIDETMKGILNALEDELPEFPIVVRRGGPGEKEAFALLEAAKQEHKLDIHYFDDTTPMTVSAKILVDLVNAYKKKQENKKGRNAVDKRFV